MSREPTRIEYAEGCCDIWELHHLCNHMAEHGWTPVQVIPVPTDVVQLAERVDNNNSPRRKTRASYPYQVLFSRPTPKDDDE